MPQKGFDLEEGYAPLWAILTSPIALGAVLTVD